MFTTNLVHIIKRLPLQLEKNVFRNINKVNAGETLKLRTNSKKLIIEQEIAIEKESKNKDILREVTCRPSQNVLLGTSRLSSENDPDKFGTLSKEWMLRERLEDLPEEDDVNVQEFIDGVEGKTRLNSLEYAKLIKTYLKQKKLRDALEVLEIRMKKEKAKPDDYIYRLLISGCAKAGYTKKAFQLFNQMKKRALKVRESIYTSLFDACANSPWPSDGTKRAEGLWNLMVEKRIEFNQQIAHAAIKAFARCCSIEKAFSIVDEMSSKAVPITSETMNFLLQACASEKEAGFRHALKIWRKMVERNLIPSTYTYNLLLRCTRDCSIGDLNRFRDDLSTFLPPSYLELIKLEASTGNQIESSNRPAIVENNLPICIEKPDVNKSIPTLLSEQPNFSGYEVYLDKVVKPWHRLMFLGGREGFINTMVKSGSKPNIKTFTLLLFIIAPSIEEEQLLMTQMNLHGIKPDLDFCNMLIKKRNMHNNFNGAKEVLAIIREQQLVPNIITFGVLALGCKTLRDMKILLNDIKSTGYRVNIEILGTLLYSACQSWDFKAIHYIVNFLIKNEVKPNYKFIEHLTNFNQDIQRHMKKKEKGEGYFTKLESKTFEKEYDDFEQLIIFVKSLEVEDPIIVHPWTYFRKQNDSDCTGVNNT